MKGSGRFLKPDKPVVKPKSAVNQIAGSLGHFLLAEDNAVNQVLACALLKNLGGTSEVAANGMEAVALYCSHSFDLILMDSQMPEMDGFEATAEIRRLEAGTNRHIPIIALTANAMAGDREKCLAAGMDDYLAKPYSKASLAATIRRWLPAPATPQLVTPATSPPDKEDISSETRPDVKRTTIDASAFDSVRAIAPSAGDTLVRKLIVAYLQNAPYHIERLTAGANNGDAVAMQKAAHALKSSSQNVGATTLSEMAREVERLLREGEKSAVVQQRVEAALSEFGRVRGALNNVLEHLPS
jgi:CheY-like chemotaxis protein/HPt (histidine-containing phosphotransfer) domain-containing protein